MDYLDKLTFLKARLSSNGKKPDVDELIKQLEIATMLITSTEAGATYSDSDRDFMQTTIDTAEKLLGRSTEDMLNEIVSTGQIPRELYNDDLPGAIPLSRVNDVPHFQVRGKSYMSDGKKVTSGAPLFFLRAMQVVRVPSFSRNVAMEQWSGYPKHAHENEWLILNYMIPGNTCVHVVALYTATPAAHRVLRAQDNDTSSSRSEDRRPWQGLLEQFWMAETAFCNERFKLIPFIAEGSWAIKMAVGQKPALLGKKLTQQYTRGPGYLEVCIDVSSSSIATGILSMVRGVSKSMVVDLGVCVQGEDEEELPEVIMCQTRFNRVDLESAVPV